MGQNLAIPAAEGPARSDPPDPQKLQNQGVQAQTGPRSQGTAPRLLSLLVSHEERLPGSGRFASNGQTEGVGAGRQEGRRKDLSSFELSYQNLISLPLEKEEDKHQRTLCCSTIFKAIRAAQGSL